MPSPRTPAALVLVVALGCRPFDAGLGDAGAVAPDDDRPAEAPGADAASAEVSPPDAPRAYDAALLLDLAPPPSIVGAPSDVGCADGTREGFPSLDDWHDIAGCSGAWTVAGALAPAARDPRCARAGGNDGARPFGEGCAISDLCAAGWHVCETPDEVHRLSSSGCEGAVVDDADRRLFIVLGGASPQGACYPDPAAANDLHGCGGAVGLSESASCDPLDHRMGFADCKASGVWQCGTDADHLREAAIATKLDSSMGGALCCRD